MNQSNIRPPLPLLTLAGLVLGMFSVCGVFALWLHLLPTIEHLYLNDYLKVSYVPKITLLKRANPEAYWFYVYADHGEDIAVTDANISALPSRPHFISRRFARPDAREWFCRQIYGGRSANELLTAPATVASIVFCLFLVSGVLLDRRRHVRFRRGRKLQGPDMRSRWSFNRSVKGDGIGLVLDNWRNPVEWSRGNEGKVIRLEREYEAQHIAVMGDTGSGKTVTIRQLLDQIEARGETAIIFDSERQMVGPYFDAERGDMILNPLDVRCPYWSPSDEIDYGSLMVAEAEALAQAESIYPGQRTDRDWFFTHASRLVWQKALVSYKPNASELSELMTHANPLIDAVVKGTELEEMFTKAQSAQGLRSSVVSTLTAPAFSLRQIPPKDKLRPSWSARSYCQHRRGWLYFTSTEETIIGLKPIQSLWIDSLIRNLLSMPARPDLPKVWIVIDELASLQYLPQLTNLMNKARKRDVSAVIGFQGRSQPRKIYGEDAETILSAPFTKILLRTGEPEAFDWMSRMIGDVDEERFRESRGGGGRKTHSWTTERVTRRLVIGSVFSGLKNRCGYLRYGNEVVPIKVSIPRQRPDQAIDYLPRRDAPVEVLPLPDLDTIKALEEAERLAKAESAAEGIFPQQKKRKGAA
jgi:Type IV secretion-system coupling protein DNA-binding domain